MGLNYAELIAPYADPTEPGGAPRTPEGQREWLTKKGVPGEIVDLAMAAVYAGLAEGKTYADGKALDHAIRDAAARLLEARAKAALAVGQQQIEQAATSLYRQRTLARKPKQLLRHPGRALKWYRAQVVAFALGAALAGGLVWFIR